MDRSKLKDSPLTILSCLPNYRPAITEGSNILDDGKIHVLHYYLPATLKMQAWKLLFTPQQHGGSQYTFMDKIEGHEDTLIVIKDTLGHIFGAYCSEE